MLIKHCVQDHCNAMSNEDLSFNEEYSMIMERDKESSDHKSVTAEFAHTPPSSSAFCILLLVVNSDASIEIYGSQECLPFPL